MRVTLSYRNFPFTEEMGLWNIHWEDITSGWAGDGTIKLKATISHNPIKLLQNLASKGYFRQSNLNLVIQSLSHGLQPNIPSYELNTICSYIEKVGAFCENNTKTITKSSYSLFNAFGGNDSCAEKCMKKIKNEIYVGSDDSLLQSFFQFIS